MESCFTDQFYVEEILHIQKSNTAATLPQILGKIIKSEGDFHIKYKEPKMCRKCSVPLKVEDKWLLELPCIYSLGFQYGDVECQMPVRDLKTLYGLFTPKIDL